jgi:cell division protein FtsW (lipid II flippase)
MFGGLIFAAEHMAHVQKRIAAWKDPISVIDGAGYQVSQSLFAISSGGWFGTGLNKGMPKRIPVVSKDFIFAAICEEYGVIFAICLIFSYISCFILIMNLALQKKDLFRSLIAAGFGLSFGFQIFLSIGGVIKFIPSTGVTLPFVSAGGSSLMASFASFAIIQGMGMKKRKVSENERH